jgi:hypothetical protein
MSDALDDLLRQIPDDPKLYRQLAEVLSPPTLQLICRDVVHSLSNCAQSQSSQKNVLYEVMYKAQEDPELARQLAICITQTFATPALLRT